MKRRLLWVLVISLMLVGCQKQKSMDSFKLGEILFSVDTSQEKIINKGVYDIRDFDVDSEGNVFILVPQTDTDWIYKFDSSGNPNMTIDFPKHMPPFHSFFINDDGYLFVRTFEKEKERMVHDVFDPGGRFMGQFILNSWERFGIELYTYARAQNNRVYFLKEKEGGYKELVYAELSASSRGDS